MWIQDLHLPMLIFIGLENNVTSWISKHNERLAKRRKQQQRRKEHKCNYTGTTSKHHTTAYNCLNRISRINLILLTYACHFYRVIWSLWQIKWVHTNSSITHSCVLECRNHSVIPSWCHHRTPNQMVLSHLRKQTYSVS
jgi:hypothetical protein